MISDMNTGKMSTGINTGSFKPMNEMSGRKISSSSYAGSIRDSYKDLTEKIEEDKALSNDREIEMVYNVKKRVLGKKPTCNSQ